MKYLDEFRNADLARRYLREIAATVTRPWTIMEICGGQTHAIMRHGLEQLLPEGLELVHGPGCPVCVTPLELIDQAHELARRPDVVLEATFRLQPAEPDTIAERLGSIRRWRQEHQPIGQKSAGSVFRNPEGDSAGRIIDELGLKEEDRHKPRVVANQVVRHLEDTQTMLINRFRHGNMILAGQTLFVLEVETAEYAALAANEAEKAANINILEVRSVGSFGRVYIGGEEKDGYMTATHRRMTTPRKDNTNASPRRCLRATP